MIRGFRYAKELLADNPGLHAMAMFVRGISPEANVKSTVEINLEVARRVLAEHGSESQLDSIKQWRLAYRRFGADPTKFRMAAESILRRLRSSGDFTDTLHPLVVLCNSFSARFALPVAALDVERIDGLLCVGPASGSSQYEGFDGVTTLVPVGEVTFEDQAQRAHARKWSHKQSAFSAITARTECALIVSEAIHDSAFSELQVLFQDLAVAVRNHWPDVSVVGRVVSGDMLTTETPYPF